MGSKVHIHNDPYAGMAPGADKEFFKKHNPYGMTVSQMRHQFQNQIAEGWTLEEALNHNRRYGAVKSSTDYKYLINDTGEDIPGLRTYESLGMEDRPLSDQFGGVHDLEQIKATIASLGFDNAIYQAGDGDDDGDDDGDGDGDGDGDPVGDVEDPDGDSTVSNYLTADDLNDWWDALDKSDFTSTNNQSQGMSDFMRFMMFMTMMRPQNTSSGSQYGYGGLNPGGVTSSYDPLSNISQLVSAFGQLPGSNSSNSTT